MADSPEKTPDVKKTSGFISPNLADGVGILSSVVVASIAAWRTVQDRAFKNLAELGLFHDIRKDRGLGKDIANHLVKNNMTAQEAHDELKALTHTYYARIKERMTHAGYGTFAKKTSILSTRDKCLIGMTTAAYGGIALGSMVLLTRGLFTPKEQQELAQKGTPPDMPLQQRTQ